MIGLNQKGNVLLYAVIAMTAISVLGTGIYFMTTTATFSGLGANDQNRAYQLALAGKDYALVKNLGKTASLYPSGRDFTFTPINNGNKFRLQIGVNDPDEIISTGIVREGTPFEAKRTITITKKDFGSQAGISFTKDIAAMGIIQPTRLPGDPTDFISKTASALSLGKIGASYQSQFGAVVYSGNAAQGNCVAGKCDFGTGFNAFFVFQFGAGSTGDGFTFAFFNGSQNDAASVGGYATRGELMGYAGNAYVSSGVYLDNNRGLGIRPPKVAVEFDPYANACNQVCTSNEPTDGSRCDEPDTDSSKNYKNHMALMFWGDNTTVCGSTEGGKYTFDDNRHDAGGGGSNESFSNARNPTQLPFDKCRYFDGNNACTGSALGWPGNWLLNTTLPNVNVYALRMEVRRKLAPETSGDHQYTLTVWIKRCNAALCPEYLDTSDYLNTKKDYTPTVPDHTLQRTIEMSSDYHDRFDKVLFGWTTATGGKTQNVNINRFKMNFLK